MPCGPIRCTWCWTPTSVWSRRTAPAIAGCLIFAVVLFLPPILNDGDTFWQISTGAWIVDHEPKLLGDGEAGTPFVVVGERRIHVRVHGNRQGDRATGEREDHARLWGRGLAEKAFRGRVVNEALDVERRGPREPVGNDHEIERLVRQRGAEPGSAGDFVNRKDRISKWQQSSKTTNK